MSMLLALIGVLLLSGGLLLQSVLPKLGRMAFSIGGGSYNPSDYDLGVAFYMQQVIAISCIVVGSILSRRFCKTDGDH
ncbi:MAG TPA: hypothetical protein DIW81_16310 [Planctomycetaceae bacterium]|nr:hypothetical protein [Planctomycetaceae bacterium]